MKRRLGKPIRDSGLGIAFAAAGVLNFAWRLSKAREPVDLPTGLLVGFGTVVLVRLILGVLTSGELGLVVAGTAVGFGEMLFLLNFHVDSTQSLASFFVCAVADPLAMVSASSLLGLAGSMKRRIGTWRARRR